MVAPICNKSGRAVIFKAFFTVMEMFSHIQILQDIQPIA